MYGSRYATPLLGAVLLLFGCTGADTATPVSDESFDSARSAVVLGTRGPNEACTGYQDCASGLCVRRNERERYCAARCDTDADCSGNQVCHEWRGLEASEGYCAPRGRVARQRERERQQRQPEVREVAGEPVDEAELERVRAARVRGGGR